jgi:hypothetical protein
MLLLTVFTQQTPFSCFSVWFNTCFVLTGPSSGLHALYEGGSEDGPVSPKHVVLNQTLSHEEIVCCVKTVNNNI